MIVMPFTFARNSQQGAVGMAGDQGQEVPLAYGAARPMQSDHMNLGGHASKDYRDAYPGADLWNRGLSQDMYGAPYNQVLDLFPLSSFFSRVKDEGLLLSFNTLVYTVIT